MENFEAAWADWLKQKTYAIYQGDTEEGEFLGIADGHDESHAINKFAQYVECDPKPLAAKRAWPNSKY